MKKIISLLLAMTMAVSLTACGEPTCKDCEKVAEIQIELKELNEYIMANRAYEGSQEFDEKESRYYDLHAQLELLMEHECTIPVTEVENKEYIMGGIIGKYTGEWKSSAPYGHGVYTAESNITNEDMKVKYVYDCEWSGGFPNGYGSVSATCSNWEYYYEGNFVDSEYSGDGYYYYRSGSIHYDITGPFSDGFVYGNGTRRELDSNCNVIFEVKGTFKGNNLSGRGEFNEYDSKGNLIDYGIVEGPGPKYTKIQSVQLDKAKQQANDAIWDIFF